MLNFDTGFLTWFICFQFSSALPQLNESPLVDSDQDESDENSKGLINQFIELSTNQNRVKSKEKSSIAKTSSCSWLKKQIARYYRVFLQRF